MSEPMESAEHPWYRARVMELESEGCTTSDAQGIADSEARSEQRESEKQLKQLRAQRDRLASILRDIINNSACPLGHEKADRFAAACASAYAALADSEPTTTKGQAK